MDRTTALRASRPVQLELFEHSRRMKPANDSDPFAASHSSRRLLPEFGKFTPLQIHRAAKFRGKITPHRLTMADAVKRSGPSDYNAE